MCWPSLQPCNPAGRILGRCSEVDLHGKLRESRRGRRPQCESPTSYIPAPGVADTSQRMWPIGIAVRIAPRKPCRSGDRNFSLQQFVVGLQIPVGHGPIGTHTILGVDPEIRRMKPRSECCPVNRSASYALAAVVRTQCQRMGSAGDAQVIPIEFVRHLSHRSPSLFPYPRRGRLPSAPPEIQLEKDAAPALRPRSRLLLCNSRLVHDPEISASGLESLVGPSR